MSNEHLCVCVCVFFLPFLMLYTFGHYIYYTSFVFVHLFKLRLCRKAMGMGMEKGRGKWEVKQNVKMQIYYSIEMKTKKMPILLSIIKMFSTHASRPSVRW